MLKLNNVNKTYVSKSKQKVEALKDVNLEIDDGGLVFILGKSGSGKSTLLNLLGGLDGATSGEISVDGQSFADFKQADYDNYRNQYVGFVFQEFNLLNDFNVEGNVALALRLSKEKDINDKVVDALNAVGLSADYLTRKINELSGGEKQRVAIARAIVKDSKVILADEPTGNLDSGTGESIWNILKDLSKSKLVIVVSHDRESAEKYGDRIIEISDGRVIADNGKQPEIQREENQKLTQTRKRLSTAVCIKMGVNNLLQRKVKSISVILLTVLTVFAILITQILLSFSSEKSFAKFISDNDIEYITVTQGKLQYGNEFRFFECFLRPSTKKYIEDNSNSIQDCYIECKQDILDMGMSFVGDALELDDNSYYLTTEGLQNAYQEMYSYVVVDGKKEKLVKNSHPAEFLVGKEVYTGTGHSGSVLAGVIDISGFSPLINGTYHPSVFPEYFEKENITKISYSTGGVNRWSDMEPEAIMQFGDVLYDRAFIGVSSTSDFKLAGGGKVLTERGLQELDDVTLADDEIVLTYKLYAALFDVDPKWSYVSTNLTEALSIPEHIGQSFSLKFTDCNWNDLLIDVGKLKIVGIAFSYQEPDQNPNYITDTKIPQFATGGETARNISKAFSTRSTFLIQVASIKKLQRFLVKFRKDYEGYVLNIGKGREEDYASFIYGFESDLYIFKIIFGGIAVILSAIMLLLVINLISFSILNRKKEIGILSALGATNGDITKIFLVETLFISVISFIIDLVAALVAVPIFNDLLFNKTYNLISLLSVPLLRFDYFSVITLVGASFGLLLLAALLPLRKIIKLKPIDAIKNL